MIIVPTRLTVRADDTSLAVTDSEGGEPPILFINGAFSTQKHWRNVLRRLGGRFRTVTFDGRARGGSGRSADLSLRGAVEDVGRVIEATGLHRPILVGWSYGATLAVRYAAGHPNRVAGVLLLDGAYPKAVFDEAMKARARKLFRQMGPIMRVLALFGLSARMSPTEAADVTIEMDQVNGELLADFEAITCPVLFIVGTGGHQGATDGEMHVSRSAADLVTSTHSNVTVFATVPCNHVQIVSKAVDAIVAAIDYLVGTVASDRVRPEAAV